MQKITAFSIFIIVLTAGLMCLAVEQGEDARRQSTLQKTSAGLDFSTGSPPYGIIKGADGHLRVAPNFAERLPKALMTITDVRQRKALFITTLLPLILKSNDSILKDRAYLLERKASGITMATINDQDRERIIKLAETYRVQSTTPELAGLINDILAHCDSIPPSLAMAQAVMESGWGTSRFAQEGNALFGQWVWGDGEGILPEKRVDGATHRIKSFDLLEQSVAAYMKNLNRHPAYQKLRERRQDLRERGAAVTGYILAAGLTEYSARGEHYVDEIRAIITFNNLEIIDQTSLAQQDMP